MTEPRRCDCHGEPMLWHRDPRKRSGGYWRCRVRTRQAHARYAKNSKRAESNARYNATPMRTLSKQLYELTRVRVPY